MMFRRLRVSTYGLYSPLFGREAYALRSDESEIRWRRALGEGDPLLAARDSGEIVGFGHARGYRIGTLYLLGSHQREGIGSALLSDLLAILKIRLRSQPAITLVEGVCRSSRSLRDN
jgi:GNAT superfamily N-acetyltransferase